MNNIKMIYFKTAEELDAFRDEFNIETPNYELREYGYDEELKMYYSSVLHKMKGKN